MENSRGNRSKIFGIYSDITPEELEKISEYLAKIGNTGYIFTNKELEQMLNGTDRETEEGIGDCGRASS